MRRFLGYPVLLVCVFAVSQASWADTCDQLSIILESGKRGFIELRLSEKEPSEIEIRAWHAKSIADAECEVGETDSSFSYTCISEAGPSSSLLEASKEFGDEAWACLDHDIWKRKEIEHRTTYRVDYGIQLQGAGVLIDTTVSVDKEDDNKSDRMDTFVVSKPN